MFRMKPQLTFIMIHSNERFTPLTSMLTLKGNFFSKSCGIPEQTQYPQSGCNDCRSWVNSVSSTFPKDVTLKWTLNLYVMSDELHVASKIRCGFRMGVDIGLAKTDFCLQPLHSVFLVLLPSWQIEKETGFEYHLPVMWIDHLQQKYNYCYNCRFSLNTVGVWCLLEVSILSSQ